MSFAVLRPEDLEFVTRSHEPAEARRHVARVTEHAGLRATRANFVRFGRARLPLRRRGAGADVRARPRHARDVPRGLARAPRGPVGGVIDVKPDTLRQVANEAGEELLLYVVVAAL